MDIVKLNDNGYIITLKEIVNIINNGRGTKPKDRGYLRHDQAMDRIEILAKEPNFGTVQENCITYNSTGQSIRTLCLTKKQAIAAGAKLDNSMLMKVVDRLEELESNKLPSTYLGALKELVRVEEKRLELEAKIKEDAPRVEFSKAIECSVNACLIGTWIKAIELEKGVKIGQNKAFKWLRTNGYLIKDGRRKNNPTQRYIDNGYFELKVGKVVTPKGVRETFTTLITGIGQVALANKINK